MPSSTNPTTPNIASATLNDPINTPVSTQQQLNRPNADYSLHDELMIMVNYATKRGIALPNNINFSLQQTNESLVSNYNTITKTIQPATVESIQFIDNYICSIKEEHKWYKTPIFSKCLFIAIGALICLISVGLLPSVNEKNQAAGILASSGTVSYTHLTLPTIPLV